MTEVRRVSPCKALRAVPAHDKHAVNISVVTAPLITCASVDTCKTGAGLFPGYLSLFLNVDPSSSICLKLLKAASAPRKSSVGGAGSAA